MAHRSKAFLVAALLTLFVSTAVGFAQTAPVQGAAEATASKPAATRPVPNLLTVVPADAWGVVGVNNMEKLDSEVMRLASKLSLPIFFAPSGLVQMGLGIMQGFDARGGIGMIFLDKIKYGQAAGWEMFPNLPAPMVLAVASTDPQEMIKSLNGKPGEEEGTYNAVLGKEKVVAAAKDGYVVFAPDATLVKAVAAVGGAPATRPVITTLHAGLVKELKDSNLFVLLNVKPITATVAPIVRGLIATFSAAAQAQAGAQGAPNMGEAAGAYFDILSKQVDRLAVLGNLNTDGLTLSALVTFQTNTMLQKVFAAIKPANQPLLADLPAGQFVLAAGAIKTSDQYAKDLAELFSKPMLDAMRSSGNPVMVAAAEQQTKIMNLRLELNRMQQSTRFGIYLQPNAENGLVAAVASGQFADGAKAYDLIKQIVKLQVDSLTAQKPKAKDFLEAVTYTPAAETVDNMKVDVLLFDVTKLPKIVPNMTETESEQLIKVVKTLLGTDGVTVRVAVGGKNIVASLGGSTPFLKKAVEATKSSAAPLVKQDGIAKVQERLPKTRVAAMYISAENALSTVDQVAKALGEQPLPFEPGQTSAPAVGMLLADPAGAHVSLYVPTELMVSVRGMVNQSMQQQRMQQMEPEPGQTTTKPGKPNKAEKPAEPKPEF